jgi:hypothetical protein
MTNNRYNKVRKAIDAYHAYINERFANKRGHVCMTLAQQQEAYKAVGMQITNELRSQVEVYEFIHNKPSSYFAYANEATKKMTTWTGEELGTIRFLTNSSRPSIQVTAINGLTYKGSYYKRYGNYCRVKVISKP